MKKVIEFNGKKYAMPETVIKEPLSQMDARTFFKALNFGDVCYNHWASDDNPRKIGFFIRKHMNGNPNIMLTDCKNDFWYFGDRNLWLTKLVELKKNNYEKRK